MSEKTKNKLFKHVVELLEELRQEIDITSSDMAIHGSDRHHKYPIENIPDEMVKIIDPLFKSADIDARKATVIGGNHYYLTAETVTEHKLQKLVELLQQTVEETQQKAQNKESRALLKDTTEKANELFKTDAEKASFVKKLLKKLDVKPELVFAKSHFAVGNRGDGFFNPGQTPFSGRRER